MKNTEKMKSMLKANSIRHALDAQTIDTLDDYLGTEGAKFLDVSRAGAVTLTMTKVVDGLVREGLSHLQLCPQIAAFAEYPDVDHRLAAFHCGIDFIRNLPDELPLGEFRPDPEAEANDYSGPLGVSLIYPDENRRMHINICSLYPGIPYERLFDVDVNDGSETEGDPDPESEAVEADIESTPAWVRAFASGVLAAMDHVTKKGWHRCC